MRKVMRGMHGPGRSLTRAKPVIARNGNPRPGAIRAGRAGVGRPLLDLDHEIFCVDLFAWPDV
ncbi:hypothetical protein, partial [uncultured Paracoccus sp.]|uniref:hypothetical protein n=1 Tax=uncultured Paracoccus sp. TaxID=189685 RepID=UPI002598628A